MNPILGQFDPLHPFSACISVKYLGQKENPFSFTTYFFSVTELLVRCLKIPPGHVFNTRS
jgi:hypothetical protein